MLLGDGRQITFWEGSPRVVERSDGRRRVRRVSIEEVAVLMSRVISSGSTPRLVTVGDLLAAWLVVRESERTLAPGTLVTYRYQARALADGLGTIRLAGLRRAHVLDYVAARVREGRSAATVEDEVRILRIALHWAKNAGHWSGVPGTVAGRIQFGPTVEKDWLRSDEARRLLAVAYEDSDPTVTISIIFGLKLGMRVGEIMSRCWGDWDYTTGRIRVGPRPELNFDTKNHKSRVLVLTPNDNAVLRAYYVQRGEPSLNQPIVVQADGSRRDPRDRWLTRQLVRLCERAGVRRITPHGLRHSFVTNALLAGVPVHVVSRAAGHHSASFTLEAYAHVATTDLAACAQALERSLGF